MINSGTSIVILIDDPDLIFSQSVFNKQITLHLLENREFVRHKFDYVLATRWLGGGFDSVSASERFGIKREPNLLQVSNSDLSETWVSIIEVFI